MPSLPPTETTEPIPMGCYARRSAYVLLAWALCVALPSKSMAHVFRVLVVVRGVGQNADRAAAFTQHAIKEILATDERYEVIDLLQTLGDPNEDDAERAYRSVRETVQNGRLAYESLELDLAIEYLIEALSELESHADRITDVRLVADALMTLGAAHLLRGEEELGAKYVTQAVSVCPEAQPDPRLFNPSMRRVFRRAANSLFSRPRGSLSLDSYPSYAAAYVDGVFVGVTPVSVAHLTLGRHYVRLVKDGYRSWGRVVQLNGSGDAAVTASFEPARYLEDLDILADTVVHQLAEGQAHEPIDAAIDQLAMRTTADRLLVGAVRVEGGRVDVWAYHFDLLLQREVKRDKHVFSYDMDPETYHREMGELIGAHLEEGTME